tara:strand:- start:544 stop:1389 length:846 start_codon:yes stop_codon:yes gene_type:complete
MIIWLASYPKSGNTWVRSIISSLLYSKDGNFNFELIKRIEQFPEKKYFQDLINKFDNFNKIAENWILAQEKINLSNEIKLFKTHQGNYTVKNNNFTNKKNTLATIYIVRDPRNLVTSISNHFSLSKPEASKFLLSPQIIGNGKSIEERIGGLYNLLGRWNEHYRSWTKNKEDLLLIKYENLVKNTGEELLNIIKFLKRYLNFDTNSEKNKKIIETTKFNNLQKMEERGEFMEAVKSKYTDDAVNFFHLGPKNNWENILDREIKNKIEKNFEQEMKELGYIN